jgi:hypothetical protein
MMRRTRTTCAHDGEREAKRSGGQPCFEVSGCEEGCSQHNVVCGSEWTDAAHKWGWAAAAMGNIIAAEPERISRV